MPSEHLAERRSSLSSDDKQWIEGLEEQVKWLQKQVAHLLERLPEGERTPAEPTDEPTLISTGTLSQTELRRLERKERAGELSREETAQLRAHRSA